MAGQPSLLSPKLGTSGVHDGADVGLLETVCASVGPRVGSPVVGTELAGAAVGTEVPGAAVGAEVVGDPVAQSPSHESMLQKLFGQSAAMSRHSCVSVPAAMLSL
jgi:hypothetical protein